MVWNERSLTKYAPLLAAAALLVVGLARLRQRRKPRSFREDPIGALKERGGMIADRAQGATEDALARLQELTARGDIDAAAWEARHLADKQRPA